MSNFEVKYPGPDSEISVPFIQGMANRLVVSHFKYGSIAENYPDKVNALASLQQRIVEYLKTGNTEFLIDVANFALIEFMCPSVPEAHFRATDSDESPGLKFNV